MSYSLVEQAAHGRAPLLIQALRLFGQVIFPPQLARSRPTHVPLIFALIQALLVAFPTLLGRLIFVNYILVAPARFAVQRNVVLGWNVAVALRGGQRTTVRRQSRWLRELPRYRVRIVLNSQLQK